MERIRLGFAFVGDGWRVAEAMFENHWLATEGLVRAPGLPQPLLDALPHTFERWDRRGMTKARGGEISLAARLVVLADVVEIIHRSGGAQAAVAVARERSGTQFDPDLVELFTKEAEPILAGLDADAGWERVVAAEPGRRLVSPGTGSTPCWRPWPTSPT